MRLLVFFTTFLSFISADRYVSQLLETLLMDYNRNVRPVKNASDPLKVMFGANLCRLIDVDEVNQILTTSLWLEMQWKDRKLVWNPADYGGIQNIHIPSDQIWIPDIVLYNNADGEPHINLASLARVDSRGNVLWQPPSIYKSVCAIDIEYFPYDLQTCELKFGGWSNNGNTLEMEQIPVNGNDKPMPRVNPLGEEHMFLQNGLGLSFYHKSAEWDLLEATSSRYSQLYQGCCGDDRYIDIRFNIVIRRKAIFFTVMLTIPSMLIANVTPFVFLIPPNEHKITFSVSVFVAFTLFYLVLIELIPPTSLVIPLIGKYLFFTLIMVTFAILISVININFYRRQAFASEMSYWQRCLFVRILPRILRLKGLDGQSEDESLMGSISTIKDIQLLTRRLTMSVTQSESPIIPIQRNRLLSLVQMDVALKERKKIDNMCLFRMIAGQLNIIAANFHNQHMEGKIIDEWRLMSLVVDRLFLIIYLVINAAMNVWFIYNSPTLFDNRPALGQEMPFKPLSGSSEFITDY